MIRLKINNVEFKLREYQDFSWLNSYGEVFSVIDSTGSGCISFGLKKDGKKYFFKVAGAKSVKAEISEEESIELLKKAVNIYNDLKYDCLINLVDEFSINEFYVAVFDFVEGDCLFDHWNFDKYFETKEITPIMKFKMLPIEKRLDVVDKLFSFFKHFVSLGYVAVDFYDSSIIYDFENDTVKFCDIDLFRKMPTFNDLGEDYFGTKRLKAPEENVKGAKIDELTSEFTLGAIIFDMFSEVVNNDERYEKGMFIHNEYEHFELSKEVCDVLLKATSYKRDERFESIEQFYKEFVTMSRR